MKIKISMSGSKYTECLLAIGKVITAKFPKFKVIAGDGDTDDAEFFCIVGCRKGTDPMTKSRQDQLTKVVVDTAKDAGYNIKYSSRDSDPAYEFIFVVDR